MKALGLLVRFLLWLVPVLLIAYQIQIRWRESLGQEPQGDLIQECYLVHGLLAFGIVSLIFFLRKRARHLVGFLFLAGSLLKFVFFFIFFYGPYSADGSLDPGEFGAFFVPYALSLVLETLFTARLLLNLEKEDHG